MRCACAVARAAPEAQAEAVAASRVGANAVDRVAVADPVARARAVPAAPRVMASVPNGPVGPSERGGFVAVG